MKDAPAYYAFFLALTVTALAFQSSANVEKPYMVIFGDSMSDNGTGAYPYITNYIASLIDFNVTFLRPISYAGAVLFQYALGVNNQPPYYQHISSNGFTWATYLATALGIDNYNYAFSGAVTGGTNVSYPGVPNACGLLYIGPADGSNIIPGVDNVLVPIISNPFAIPTFLDKVTGYAQNQTSPVPPSTLYFLEIGGNDVVSFVLLNKTTSEIPKFAQGMASAFTQALDLLYGVGGRKFIIFNLGLIFQLPYIAHKFSAEDLMMIKRVEAAAQYEVNMAVKSFADAHPDAQVKIFPLSDVVANITRASPANGFENVTAQCYNNTSPSFTQPSLICKQPMAVVCPRPDGFLYWDGYHFATAGHKAISSALQPYAESLMN